MPFKRRSSYTLTLAIMAATPLFLYTTDSHAQEPSAETHNKDEMLWNCQMSAGQDWQCDLGKELQEQGTQPVTSTQSTQSHTSTGSSAENSVDIEPATKVEPVTKTVAIPQEPVISQPASEATRPTVANAWNCEADSQGAWACDEGTKKPNLGKQGTAAAISGSGDADFADTDSADTDFANKSTEIESLSPYAHLDWYPYAANANQVCRGQYIEPDYQVDTEGGTLKIDADNSQTKLGGLTTLQGNVLMRQDGRTLRGDKAELDQFTNIATLSGGVTFREPGLLLIGETAQTNIDSGETVLTKAEYVLHEPALRGSADRIIRLTDNRIRIESGAYTACPPGDNSWKISGSSLMLDPNTGFGEVKHATLDVAGTPVLYLPYFRFPIDDRRLSGFLYPTVRYSDSEGLEFATPYYFNLAENYDDTLTPHFFGERGVLFENEFRHLSHYGTQALSTGYMFDDDKTGEDRWLLGLDHTGKRGNWSTAIDYNAVSDDDYFDDLGTTLEVNRDSHLDKFATATYQQDNWQVTTTAHSYQTIDDDKAPYRTLPQVSLTGEQDWQANKLEFDYLVQATDFDRDLGGLTGIDRVTGSRIHLQPSLSMPMLWPWAYINPKVSYWHTQYDLDDQLAGEPSSIDRGVGIYSINSGLTFERPVKYGQSTFSQTLEPRAFMLYVPDEDQSAIPDFDTTESDFSYQNLFRENRFSGLDKIGDSQQLSLGISSAFFEASGFERARLNLGQAFYFDDRNVQLNGINTVDTSSQSNYAAEAIWNVNKDTRVTMDTELENSDLGVEESNLKLSYKPSLNKIFNFSYRHREDVRQQTDTSFLWPVSQTWNVLGRWVEDFENNQTPEALLGLEYASCCWKLRVAVHHWIESDTEETEDNAVYLQFILKGLGALGNGGSALEDIIGFKEREENDDY
ncbi:MAG: LPS assembly protein LptD [Amphritea sp.]